MIERPPRPTDKTVAIKVLHRELAVDGLFAERFRREARAASRLDHPNSIRVFDFGQEPDGLLYLAMEYVEGRDLFALLSEHGPLPPASIVDLLSQVLSALTVAHDLGVLHRDLKPENIMIVRGEGDDGQPIHVVKVCDFGIAKIVDTSAQAPEEDARRHTTKGLVVGTPEYMSPEQARGEVLDGRSDLYSVGVILYELLAGRVPFEGDSPLNIVLKHVGEIPAPPSSRALGVDGRLEAICMKALEKRPADRFANAREMRLALRSALGPSPVASRRASSEIVTLPDRAEPRGDDSKKATLEGLTPQHVAQPPRRSRSWLIAALAVPAAGGLLFLGLRSGSRTHTPPNVPAPAQAAQTAAAFSVPVVRDPVAAPVDPIAPPAAAPPTRPVDAVVSTSRATEHEKRPRRAKVDVSPAAPTEPAPTPPTLAAANDAIPPPVQAPAPVAPAAPAIVAAPPTPAPPVAPPAPAYDLASARVDIGQAVGTIGTTSSSVTRAVSEASAQLTSCYRSVLPRLTDPIEGRGTLHVETDGAGVITIARLMTPMDAMVARCAASAIQGRRVANVDTGSASADVPMAFRAH
jgi:serine/threonine protein kinase